MRPLTAIVCVLALLLPIWAKAGVIAAFEPRGGNEWSVKFTVSNDSPADNVAEFTIYFSHLFYSDIAFVSSPIGWDLLSIQPDATLASDGFVDGLALSAQDALAPGESQGDFIVDFTYLGSGAPGNLVFEFLDADFNVIASGTTRREAMTVPEPPAGALMVAAVVLIGMLRRGRAAGEVSRRAK